MTPERWGQIKRLYDNAQALQPAKRAAFLAEACRDDDELRCQVEKLLDQPVGTADFVNFLGGPAPALTARTDDDEVVPSLKGRRLGPYELETLLGRGGMGEVYRARDTRLNRTVAIKVLPPRIADNFEARERFEREARAASSLNHPNICTIHDIGEQDSRPFIVMERLEGQTLKHHIQSRPLPIEEVLRFGMEVLSALEAAHAKGIVHRDIKPANIFITDRGQAKVLDFGLAKLVAEVESVDIISASAETTTGDHHTLTQPGMALGTLSYMSPEQARGRYVDARSDLFSSGAVLYEMATGRQAFLTSLDWTAPPPTPEIDPELYRIVLKLLEPDPEKRYQAASVVLADLKQLQRSIESKQTARHRWLTAAALPALAMVVVLGGVGIWSMRRNANIEWARTRALPEIARLVDQERLDEAYGLAVQAEQYIENDPTLANLWPRVSWAASIETTPRGASVYRRNYAASEAPWEFVGRSPIEKWRTPLVDSEWKIELDGFTTVERVTFYSATLGIMRPFTSLSVTLDETAKTPEGMVRVSLPREARYLTAGFPALGDLQAIPLDDYWLDRYEVTNKQFKEFVEHGGYRNPEYWKHEFRKDGRTLSSAEAMTLFRDATGRPGPSTWELGNYPAGQENVPVSGVSWYEAAAFAEFAGKSLPTFYHWAAAASTWASASIVPVSNFAGPALAPVGRHRGMSWSGAYDMAGNVKEWVWNDAGSDKRDNMGGGSDEPEYFFNEVDARAPFDRSSNLGFRCAKYSSDIGRAADPLINPARNLAREKPASAALFGVYRSMYSYDKTPLDAVVESVENAGDWTVEKITFAAAYGNERVIAHLFLPKRATPPFQTVLLFPGSNAISARAFADFTEQPMRAIDFVIKSGRAVMFPVYKGTFERRTNLTSDWPDTTVAYRDHVIAWSKDLARSIDYLETRPEIDHDGLALEGVSWGASMGTILLAVEDRFKAGVLINGGFYLQRTLPEVDGLNFAPRVRIPTLMLNGRYDFFNPLETSQLRMFRLLGTSEQHKRHVLYETSHSIPRLELIKETLDWLDRYLGPVR
jgi:serine/threonine protein kinase/formylglycine-generating enzyme required for sulfatase activity/cephalosporin-C deacetylase-like acetyl esterase